MEQAARSRTGLLSLYDMVVFAAARPSLLPYTLDQLARLYLYHKRDTFLFHYKDAAGMQRVCGVAIAFETGGPQCIRIAHIAHDGRGQTMAEMVSTLRERFPAAREMKFDINKLKRLLEINYGRHA